MLFSIYKLESFFTVACPWAFTDENDIKAFLPILLSKEGWLCLPCVFFWITTFTSSLCLTVCAAMRHYASEMCSVPHLEERTAYAIGHVQFLENLIQKYG